MLLDFTPQRTDGAGVRPRPGPSLLRHHRLGGHQWRTAADGTGADNSGLPKEETETGKY